MNIDMNVPILKSITSDQGNQKVEVTPQPSAVQQLNSVDEGRQSGQISEKPISSDELESVVTEMNSVAQDLQRDLQFSVDEKSGGTFVKVIDKETEEVVREIPSKEVREIKARLEEVAGLIFRESV